MSTDLTRPDDLALNAQDFALRAARRANQASVELLCFACKDEDDISEMHPFSEKIVPLLAEALLNAIDIAEVEGNPIAPLDEKERERLLDMGNSVLRFLLRWPT